MLDSLSWLNECERGHLPTEINIIIVAKAHELWALQESQRKPAARGDQGVAVQTLHWSLGTGLWSLVPAPGGLSSAPVLTASPPEVTLAH